MKLLIGLVGEKGSGKGTFVKTFSDVYPEKHIVSIRSGEILLETLASWGIEPTRQNLQKLAVAMDDVYGKGTLTNAVRKKILETDADIIIFDGVRWMTDVRMVQEFPSNLIVYITADVRTRYERTKLRKEKKGEENTSYEHFLKEESALSETTIHLIALRADVVIDNDGKISDLKRQIRSFFGTLSLA